MPIDASNVMLVHKGKTVRLGYSIDKKGQKVRFLSSGSTHEVVDLGQTDAEAAGGALAVIGRVPAPPENPSPD